MSEQVDRNDPVVASSIGRIPSHQSIAQLKQWISTIGSPVRAPPSTTWISPSGRSRMRPPGAVTAADSVLQSTIRALTRAAR